MRFLTSLLNSQVTIVMDLGVGRLDLNSLAEEGRLTRQGVFVYAFVQRIEEKMVYFDLKWMHKGMCVCV